MTIIPDHPDYQAFADHMTHTGTGVIVTSMVVSDSLLEENAFLTSEHEHAARAFYDRPDCDYHYLTPDEYEYSPGPFAYRYTPGDLPEGAELVIGRVRVTRRATP